MVNKYWTKEEERILKEIYSISLWETLLEKLPGRSAKAIKNKAETFFLKREVIDVADVAHPIEVEIPRINKELEKENELLKQQLDSFVFREKFSILNYRGERVKIGIVSDVHLGSLYERLDILALAYKVFADEGITTVYNCGDLIDGESMYRGHQYEIRIHGADAQINHFVDSYPQVDGIKTHFITGNHDLVYQKTMGLDIGHRVNELRDDMKYLGPEQADIEVHNGKGKIILRLFHPGGGTAYAISYRMQKIVESFTGGEKPHILCVGHFHKSEYLPFYRNVAVFQAGTLQMQTSYMARKSIAAMVGFWILEFGIDKTNSITRLKGEFFPYFEKGGKQ